MVKLTPNVGDIAAIGRAAVKGGADAAVADQHLQFDHGRRSRHPGAQAGGARPGQPRRLLWSRGQADRALHGRGPRRRSADSRYPSAASAASRRGKTRSSSCSWAPARCRSARPSCTMGSALVEQLASGLESWMLEKGFENLREFVGKSTPRIKTWGELDLNYKVVAEIDQQKCIHCGLCYIACEDGAHQSIRWERRAVRRLRPGQRPSGPRPSLRRRGSAAGRGRRRDQSLHDQGGHLRRLQSCAASSAPWTVASP